MVTRIVTSSCTKCKGALKQSTDDSREWSCMNCGKLFLFLNPKEEEIQRLGRSTRGAMLPGEDSQRSKDKAKLEQSPEADSEGDDEEWNRLNGKG